MQFTLVGIYPGILCLIKFTGLVRPQSLEMPIRLPNKSNLSLNTGENTPRLKLMVMPEIIYQTKKELHPRFGYAIPSEQIIYVRGDLPNCVRKFVTEHELYHLRDEANWWVWRETKANMGGALKHPIGFLLCVMMSLAPYRLKYYWKRIIGENE